MKKWYYALNGQQQGPVSSEELRQMESYGTIHSLTLVWCPEMTDWTALGSVPAALLPPVAGQPPSVLPAMIAAPSSGALQGGYSQAPAPAAWQRGPERAYQFEFHGRAGEFFRIWIVNVVLTVLTFGIYHAWAKVRTLRFFCGNTLLDGKPFDFTGNPIAILKGNLIFGGLFLLYVVAGSIVPPLALAVMVVIVVISPWLIQKALRFRAHNTVHRNVRFNFRGTVGDAYTVFLWLGLLVAFTLGLIFPYIQFCQKKYILGNAGWGDCRASMNGTASYFYKKAIPILLIFALFFVAMFAAIAIPAYSAMSRKARERAGGGASNFSSSFVLAQADPGNQAAAAQDDRAEAGISSDSTPDESETGGPGMGGRDRSNGTPGPFGTAEMIGIAAAGGMYALLLAAFLVYQIRINNYSLNVTQWGDVGRLESTIRARDMLWLYFTNALAVLISLGLLSAWVRVRMARYRASRTKFIAAGSLDAVAQSIGTGDSALGEAGADIFDFDIGF
jgi:uncharacterized membrane protein YjgN (DUF898 family)